MIVFYFSFSYKRQTHCINIKWLRLDNIHLWLFAKKASGRQQTIQLNTYYYRENVNKYLCLIILNISLLSLGRMQKSMFANQLSKMNEKAKSVLKLTIGKCLNTYFDWISITKWNWLNSGNCFSSPVIFLLCIRNTWFQCFGYYLSHSLIVFTFSRKLFAALNEQTQNKNWKICFFLSPISHENISLFVSRSEALEKRAQKNFLRSVEKPFVFYVLDEVEQLNRQRNDNKKKRKLELKCLCSRKEYVIGNHKLIPIAHLIIHY